MHVLTVSDIHGDIRSLGEDVAKRKLAPDLILLLGDLTFTPALDSSNAPERARKRLKDMMMLFSALSRIQSRCGIGFLLGNDDYRGLATRTIVQKRQEPRYQF